ncbi:pyridoxal-phosphate dependent enzyme family protein [Rhodococcus sp. MTM3W5.2]|uniref:serine/threonine dehydratase n=1 Tax=Rhodococcus sp. MTM3W5.2 TaxID=1805827 RepID=UPI0009795BFB|nr:serine/threonine dehydratase [Rhodococcus sp. MTM3W5.2]AQA22221.1 pyridoxal-phosphate dependent enzyme family protein [Rhodococcus sp. MTM3W5.2]
MTTREEVLAARERVGPLVRRTPVLRVVLPTPGGDIPVALKLEQLQLGGSFKIRGSLNAMLNRDGAHRDSPVVIASGGNAGIAAATAAGMLGIVCTVVVPAAAPTVKVDRLRALGAEVVLDGERYADAYVRASAIAAQRGAQQLHAYDLPDVVAGAGVVGLELTEEVPEADTVLVAVGGGGLVAGIAAALEGEKSVVGVEPSGAPTLSSALAAGSPVDVAVHSIAADALGATRLGDIAMDVARRTGIGSVLVEDEAITEARNLLWREFRLAVEHAAAAPIAALLSGAYAPAEGERVAAVICGANTDPTTLPTG